MKRHAFSLIEMMAVIVIIMIMAGITLATVGHLTQKAAENKTQTQFKRIEMALETYRSEWGFYPSDAGHPYKLPPDYFDSGDGDCLKKKNDKVLLDWEAEGFNLNADGDECLDAFDGPIYYKQPGTMNDSTYDLWSGGADLGFGDGASSNETDAFTTSETNDDVTNWKRSM